MEKGKKRSTTKIVLLAIGGSALLLLLIFSGMLVNHYVMPEEEVPARLIVEDAYFVKKSEQDGNTSIDVFLFVTNKGNIDCKSYVRAFSIDKDTNLAMDDAQTGTVTVNGMETVEISLEIIVPSSEEYRMEFLIFKGDRIDVKGKGSIDLTEEGTAGEDYDTTFESEPDLGGATPVAPVLAIVATVLIALVASWRWKR